MKATCVKLHPPRVKLHPPRVKLHARCVKLHRHRKGFGVGGPTVVSIGSCGHPDDKGGINTGHESSVEPRDRQPRGTSGHEPTRNVVVLPNTTTIDVAHRAGTGGGMWALPSVFCAGEDHYVTRIQRSKRATASGSRNASTDPQRTALVYY